MNIDPRFNFAASIGDVVSVQKGPFTHVGVVVPGGILQNRPSGQESIISWQEFSGGQPVNIQHMGLDEWVVMTRVRAILATLTFIVTIQGVSRAISPVTVLRCCYFPVLTAQRGEACVSVGDFDFQACDALRCPDATARRPRQRFAPSIPSRCAREEALFAQTMPLAIRATEKLLHARQSRVRRGTRRK